MLPVLLGDIGLVSAVVLLSIKIAAVVVETRPAGYFPPLFVSQMEQSSFLNINCTQNKVHKSSELYLDASFFGGSLRLHFSASS